jgi:hypothetical protein
MASIRAILTTVLLLPFLLPSEVASQDLAFGAKVGLSVLDVSLPYITEDLDYDVYPALMAQLQACSDMAIQVDLSWVRKRIAWSDSSTGPVSRRLKFMQGEILGRYSLISNGRVSVEPVFGPWVAFGGRSRTAPLAD